MRWSLEQQLTNVETRIKELQKRKKMLLAKIAEVEQQKEQKSLKELYTVLQRVVSPLINMRCLWIKSKRNNVL